MEMIQQYVVPVIIGVCFGVGQMIKPLEFIPNKYIPLIMGLLGVGLNILANNGTFNIEILLGGLASGLASTGVYEMSKSLTNKKDNEGK